MSAYRIIKHIEHQAKNDAYELIVTTASGQRIIGALLSHNEYFVELDVTDDSDLVSLVGNGHASVFIPTDRVDSVVPRWL